MGLETRIDGLIAKAEQSLRERFLEIDRIEEANFSRVLNAFRAQRIAAHHFSPSSGYGYDDAGRDALERVFADVFGSEDALVRPSIASGTHALALCLFGLLRPGDAMLSGCGKPYDTLESVIGISGEDGQGSLKEFGISYSQVDLLEDGTVDIAAILERLGQDSSIKLVLLQRSKGYEWRKSLSIEDIEGVCFAIHQKYPTVIVMVDNCYGEFVEEKEPSMAGADVMAGSLIKNPGGGLAPTGGYILGRRDLVEKCAYRLTSPGIGREVGSYQGGYTAFYQGLFFAPHVVAQAVKGACLAAAIFKDLGYDVNPQPLEKRSDIIQAIRFGEEKALISFCEAIQYASPVDSFVTPEPWGMPGYQDKVIMAAGTFVSGASIELSADAPVRPPYIAYMQGGLTYAHVKIALKDVLLRIVN